MIHPPVVIHTQAKNLAQDTVIFWAYHHVYSNRAIVLVTMQAASQPLRDSTDLRDNVHVALANFKETCGLAPIANVKQCIRLLATRIANLVEPTSLVMTMKGEVSLY